MFAFGLFLCLLLGGLPECMDGGDEVFVVNKVWG